jgi:hypothetical protein
MRMSTAIPPHKGHGCSRGYDPTSFNFLRKRSQDDIQLPKLSKHEIRNQQGGIECLRFVHRRSIPVPLKRRMRDRDRSAGVCFPTKQVTSSSNSTTRHGGLYFRRCSCTAKISETSFIPTGLSSSRCSGHALCIMAPANEFSLSARSSGFPQASSTTYTSTGGVQLIEYSCELATEDPV